MSVKPGQFWSIPRRFPNSTVVIVAGGPSVSDLDLNLTREADAVLAVNNAVFLLPWAKAMFFGDRRWFRWHGARLSGFDGRIITASLASFDGEPVTPVRLEKVYDTPLADPPWQVAGMDSGYMAINVAVHWGASRIVLAGYDMKFDAGRAHWHGDHEYPSAETNYTDTFAPQYPALQVALAQRGIELVRCTPSTMSFIPELPLAEALALPRRERLGAVA